ncbi:MAG: carboxypeptidase regulatory-like domain-containing protein [Caldisericaceae bacterium]|nr:carboxypeptidase regulatory-like domain-containing protein [Caldisericaceae bacterium]
MRSLISILFISLLPFLLFGQTGKLKGLVRELYSGKPVEKVQVKVIPSNRTMETDSTGTFLFDNLEVGEYSVIFTKIGYLQHVIPCIKIEADSTAYLRIIMEKVPPAVKDQLEPVKKKKQH